MTAPAQPRGVTRQGHYAGAISRLVAFIADIWIAWGALLLVVAGISAAIGLVTGHTVHIAHVQATGLAVVAIWYPMYFIYQWSLSGKSLGMAIFGLRVVTSDGAAISAKQAVVRALFLPVSIVCFALGLVGIVLRKDHRAWHDRAAKTCVVYDWDARAARLRWLARKNEPGTVDLPATKA
jgi:uncharacterized RDD family membrane protein YckC